MTPADVYRCIEAVQDLPLPAQAVCVQLAAEVNVPVWHAWCTQRQVQDYSGALLATFDQWLRAEASNEQLNLDAQRFLATLPQDLRVEDDPTGGFAGWALLGIATIALGQGKEVHHSILHTTICYAAAAYCKIEVEPVSIGQDRLTPAELAFLDRWWQRCRDQFPELR